MPQIIPTAQRVLQVFEVYAKEKRPLSNSEMARLLGLADSSCSDLLYTLRQAGYLLRAPKTRFFHPTGKLLDVAQGIASADPMQIFASEALEILSRKSGESSMCAHLDGHHVKIFACQESSRALRFVLNPGTLVSLHVSSLGKALLGTMDEKNRNELIESLPMEAVTAHSIVDKALLLEQLKQGKEKKYYFTRNEGNEGVFAIAIAGYVGTQLTAISMVGPTLRMEHNFEKNVEIMLDAHTEFFQP